MITNRNTKPVVIMPQKKRKWYHSDVLIEGFFIAMLFLLVFIVVGLFFYSIVFHG
jgi:hypothetical protein